MAWVPKSEITSLRSLRQKGQRGALRGCSASGRGFCLGDSIALLLEAAEHLERTLVDGPRSGPAADRVPPRPVHLKLRLRHLELLGKAPAELAALGPKPLRRLLPGAFDGGRRPELVQPAVAVE